MFQLFLTTYCPVLPRDGSLVEEKKYAHHVYCTYPVAPVERQVAAAQKRKDGKDEAMCQQELTRLVAHNENVLKRAKHAARVRRLCPDICRGTIGTTLVVNGVVRHMRLDKIHNQELYVRDNNAYHVYSICTGDSFVPVEWRVLADVFHKTYGPTGYRSIQTGDVRMEPLEPAQLAEAYALAKMRGRRDGFLGVQSDSPVASLPECVRRKQNPFGAVCESNGLNKHAMQYEQTQDALYHRIMLSARFITAQYRQTVDQEHARIINSYYKHMSTPVSTPVSTMPARLLRAVRATWSQPPLVLTPLDKERLCTSYIPRVSMKAFSQRWAIIIQDLQQCTNKYLSEWT
jgi:hypothetical protein